MNIDLDDIVIKMSFLPVLVDILLLIISCGVYIDYLIMVVILLLLL